MSSASEQSAGRTAPEIASSPAPVPWSLRSSIHGTIVKVCTLALLATLLITLRNVTQQASPAAYLAFFSLILLQGLEMLFPALSDARAAGRTWSSWVLLRLSILLQLILASILVAETGGSGSIYELVYLLPIVSAATRLAGWEVVLVVGSAVVAMIGFIVTGEELTASIGRVKDFQDAVATIVYLLMAGILIYFLSRDERARREHYQAMSATLTTTNQELERLQAELTERLAQLAKMEERIQRVSQMEALGELSAQVAHEVRTPLGIIAGTTEMLARHVSEPGTQQHLAVLLEEVDRLNKAVDNILRLGTPFQIKSERVNIQEVLRSVAQATGVWAVATPHKILLETAPQALWILGDRELLHHALSNLVRNAFQAMTDAGTVTLSAELDADGQAVPISVRDTGAGMSPEDLKRLGEPFFTKRAGGIGLGFALVRRIVGSHGGSMQVQSELGRGTVITLRLPMHGRSTPDRDARSLVAHRQEVTKPS